MMPLLFEMNAALLYPLRIATYIMIGLMLLSNTTQQRAAQSAALTKVKTYVHTHGAANKSETNSRSVNSIAVSGYDVSQSLPSGFVKDGSRDYTTYIQQALDAHDDIVFPPFPLLVNETGLKLHSNHKISFTEGSQLLLKPSSKQSYDILSIKECSNVSIYNPKIKGDKFNHSGSGGEWGMGIGIYASKNIEIIAPDISETWGDGIYIGPNSAAVTSSDIYVENAYIHNCRRNGVSITSGKNITLKNPHVTDISGTLPEDGIDVEPNSSTDEIANISIIAPLTENNKGYGVEFSLSKMYGGDSKNIDAMVSDHTDNGSKSAAYISCDPKNSKNGETISGIITFQTPQWKNYGEYVWRPYGLQENNIILALVNPSLYADGTTKMETSSAVAYLKKEIYPDTQVYIFNVEL